MIVKILTSSASFNGVNYNANKVDRNKGELMKVANFGPLQGLGTLRPQDYINYLKLLSAQNKRISKPQFHAVISAKGKAYDKVSLTAIAEDWLKEMGYGKQPYLIVYHKDTENNHVHMVTTRVQRDGKKISSAFEKVRAVQNLNKVLGYDFALQYSFSTRAQFLTLLENEGFLGIDPNEKLIQAKINQYVPDKNRAAAIKAILEKVKNDPHFQSVLKEQYHIDLVFHAAEGKKPYGYTLIDHDEKKVFKGREVYLLKELLNEAGNKAFHHHEKRQADEYTVSPASIQSIWIADDVDDQQIHGMKRKRQKKARTNTR